MPRHLRSLSLLLSGALIAGACGPDGSERGRALAGELSQEPPVERELPPRTRELDESRDNAIVRAASRVAPAVVSVNVIRREQVRPRTAWERFFLPPGASRRTPGLGSGFVVDPGGAVLTNEHVVRGAERIMVTLPDGRDLEGTLLGADPVTDLAVIRVEPDEPLPPAPLGSSDDLVIGQWAIALGNPFGNLFSNTEPTVTAGVVSALGRHIVPSDEERGFYLGMIQTDASINPGNSGGPLVDARGEVIGVNTSIFSRSGGSEGVGFAIPIDRAVRIAADLLEHGEVRRAWIGVEVEPVEADVWGRTRGVRISRIVPESPAAEAGLRPGERLVTANGRRLAAPLDYEALLLDLRSGDRIALEIEGRGSPIELTADELPSHRAERVRVLEAMELITVTPDVRAEQGIVREEGALIVDITPEAQAALGLHPGDVLLQINQTRIATAEEAARALRDFPGGTIQIYFERNGGTAVRQFYWRR